MPRSRVPPELARFYVENGVGRRITEAINLFTTNHGCSAVVQHIVHPEMQDPQEGDEWWVTEMAERDHIILTKDLEMFRAESERRAIIESRARIIGFARGNYTGWQMLGGLASHWSAIEPYLLLEGPWMLKIYAGPTAPVLMPLD